MAYTLKFAAKVRGQDFKVPTIEGSWWIHAGGVELAPAEWRWQLFIMAPDFIHETDVEQSKLEVAKKKRDVDPAGVRLERIKQGHCVQILHVGPYATEEESIEKLVSLMKTNRLEAEGPHHEVYLSDPKRTRPEAVKTILRQGVKPSA